jgi:hypothetical protein
MAFQNALTLCQIEIVRAIMLTGSVSGAARLLNVTQPGISRALKYLESSLGLRLFIRQFMHCGTSQHDCANHRENRLNPLISATDVL